MYLSGSWQTRKNKMKHTDQLPLQYVMVARTPLLPEVLPRLTRQLMVLFRDLLNWHFHFVKAHFEPAADLIIAGEQEKWCCPLDKSPASRNIRLIKRASWSLHQKPVPSPFLKTIEEVIQDKTITTLGNIHRCKWSNCSAILFQAVVKVITSASHKSMFLILKTE